MLTPRQNFKDSPFAKGWQSVVDSAQFQAAAQAALLEMTIANRSTPDMATSAAVQKKMEGAIAFLSLMMGLTTSAPERSKPSLSENLDHRS